MKKLDINIYFRYVEAIDRYLELIPDKEKEKVDIATLNINYAIQDINRQIESYNIEKPEMGTYYQFVVKTDFLIEVLRYLYPKFIDRKLDSIGSIFKKDTPVIKRFKLIRSLTLAHPLETTYFKNMGFGPNDSKWCEDIIPRNDITDLFRGEDFKKADYIILIRDKDQGTEPRPILLDEDILVAARTALYYLDKLTKNIEKKVIKEIGKLKEEKINIDKKLPIDEYIHKLKKEVKKRYPDEFEHYCIDNNGQPEEVEYCILDDALDMIQVKFSSDDQEKAYEKYRQEIIRRVYRYADGIQNMDIEKEKVILENIISPNPDEFEKRIDSNNSNSINYMCSKISSYLSRSNKSSSSEAISKLKEYTYEGCKAVGKCTNSEWGVIQLFMLKDQINKYFPLDFNLSDKVLYAQYCAALYCINNE
ncbi:hypothetical protein lbkm_2613 [Lachnospiraceae bacterium KM106-2]|nr:hypothetical protein lbkm_2613 [Lachnospiraceae bacterium KM106-2]